MDADLTNATPRPAIKPLEWHKSHITPWNDDWHTISPFIYSIRCADENGWKWSAHGGHGYASTAAVAKADAQADYVRRIRSALVEIADPANKALIDELVGAVRLSKDEFQQLLSEVADPDIKAAIKFRIAHCIEVLALAKTAEGGK